MAPLLDSPDRWLRRAERARMAADAVDDAECKALLRGIADDLERLALRLDTLRQERDAS